MISRRGGRELLRICRRVVICLLVRRGLGSIILVWLLRIYFLLVNRVLSVRGLFSGIGSGRRICFCLLCRLWCRHRLINIIGLFRKEYFSLIGRRQKVLFLQRWL